MEHTEWNTTGWNTSNGRISGMAGLYKYSQYSKVTLLQLRKALADLELRLISMDLEQQQAQQAQQQQQQAQQVRRSRGDGDEAGTGADQ